MHINLAPQCDATMGCITCADEGIEMQVISAGPDGLAVCTDAAGAASEVDTTLVDPVGPGHTILVHAGVAIARLDREALP